MLLTLDCDGIYISVTVRLYSESENHYFEESFPRWSVIILQCIHFAFVFANVILMTVILGS